MKLQGVELIPSGLVNCFAGDLEVRVVKLGYEGFSFRTPEKLEKIERLTLHFLEFNKSSYQEVVVKDSQIGEKEEVFYVLYTVFTKQADYRASVQGIMKDYSQYISLKLSEDDGYLSEELTGYPAEEDEVYPQDWIEQKKEWFGTVNRDSFHIEHAYELALSLDTKAKYQQYLSKGVVRCQRELLEDNYLAEHPLFQKAAERIYIGNEFCHNLLPTKEQYIPLLEKARKEKLAITLVFTYMRDEYVEETKQIVECIYEWCKREQQLIEVVVNDWGMVQLLKDKHPYIQLNLGVLLNKRRKDPRYSYKRGIQEHSSILAKNQLNEEEFQSMLRKKWNIKRFEYEAGPLPVSVPQGHHSLHVPYYQTNTSQYCTLYAACQYGDRGNQRLVRDCPGYCEEKVFLYPKHLNMVGRYNSLFGCQTSILFDSAELNEYLSQGIDRVVLNLL